MIINAGAKLEFLPSYSSDYNAIEYSFSVLKRHLKSHNYLSNINEGDDVEFANAIIAAARNAVTAEISRNQFRHCGFRIQ